MSRTSISGPGSRGGAYYGLYGSHRENNRQAEPKLRVGGPATAQAAWVDRFIAHCIKAGAPLRFRIDHIYGNESPKDDVRLGRAQSISRAWSRGQSKKVHDQVLHSGAPRTPIIISEFNAAYLNRVDIEDSAFMGPWLAETIRACDGLTSMMAYWTFSDVFEEQGVVKRPFYGGFGLIAERGIPKASLRAFELLHQLGNQRLDSASDNTLVTRSARRFSLADRDLELR